MSKRNSHQNSPQQLQIPIISVPCQFRSQSAAFQLGARDGFCKSKVKRQFALPQTQAAYAVGVLAGTVARTQPNGRAH